jgi:hypothetical protein
MNKRFENMAYFILIFTVYCASPMEKEETKKPRIAEVGGSAIDAAREQLLKAIENTDLLRVEDILKKFSEKERLALLNDYHFGKYVLEPAFISYKLFVGNPRVETALKIFETLLEYGADINLPFEWRPDIMRTLLSDQLSDFTGTYHYTDKSLVKVKFLLNHGADPEKKTVYQKTYDFETSLQFINRMIKAQKNALAKLLPTSKARVEREKALANTLKVKTLLENTIAQRGVQQEAARKGTLQRELKAKERERILGRVPAHPEEVELEFLKNLQREQPEVGVKMED